MDAQELKEGQMIQLVRNALLVAGQEMGEGDHMPVIKSTIHQIMKDWEAVKIERNVDEQLKIHLYKQLEYMERDLGACTVEEQIATKPKLKELREIYDAYFVEPYTANSGVSDDEMPIYIKQAKAIIQTLEEDNG